jgi:hypothetical protein
MTTKTPHESRYVKAARIAYQLASRSVPLLAPEKSASFYSTAGGGVRADDVLP